MTYRAKSEFLHVMTERGYLADCTDLQALDDALINGPVTAYIGYDATAANPIGRLFALGLRKKW